MPRLLDLVLSSSAPSAVMQNAASGKLNVPPMERLEILVDLASHAELGEQAWATGGVGRARIGRHLRRRRHPRQRGRVLLPLGHGPEAGYFRPAA